MRNNIRKSDKVSNNAIIYTVGNFLNQAVAILLSPVFTRLLSVQEYGRVTVYITWVGFFTILTGLELAGSLTNAYFDFGVKNYKAYAKTCIVTSILITFLWIIIVAFFHEKFESIFNLDYHFLILAFLHGFFNNIILYLSKYLSLLNRAIPYVLISFCQLVLNVVLSLLFIIYLDWRPDLSRIYGQFIPCALFGILVSVMFLWNKEKIINLNYLKYGIQLSIPLIFHTLGGIILSGSDKIMLSRIANDSEAGIYSFAVTVISVIHAVSVSFNIAWIPYLYEMLKKGNLVELEKRISKYLGCYTIISCGFLFVMPEMVKLLADKAYWDCIIIVIPLTMGEFFRFLYFFPVNYEFYNKQNQWIASATAVTGIINIVLNYLWIPHLGMYGAVMSTLISYFLCFLFHEIVARRVIGGFFIRISTYLRYTIFLLLNSVFICVVLKYSIIRWSFALIYGAILVYRIIKEKSLF